MYKYKFNYHRIEFLVKIFALILIVEILPLFIMGIWFIVDKYSMSSSTISTRVEVETAYSRSSTMYSPVYYYNVDGVEYGCKSHLSSSIIPSEKQAKIFYNSKNNSKCISEYEYNELLNSIFPTNLIIIILTIFIGIIFYIPAYRHSKMVKRLAQSGKLIKNFPCSVIFLPGYMLYTQSIGHYDIYRGYIIRFRYKTDDDKFLILNSEVKFDSTDVCEGKDRADLLIDPANPKNYFIDFHIEEV